MRILIVEDDFTSRRLMSNYLSPQGECDVAVNGAEAVDAFKLALDENHPYDLICLDIMMPEVDGQEALKQIREIETERGIKGSNEVKIIMTTAMDDPKTVIKSYGGGATAYMVKPIVKDKLYEEMRSLGLL